MGNLSHGTYIRRTIALYQYFFQLSGTLPDPSEHLSSDISPAAIKDTNKAVKNALCA